MRLCTSAGGYLWYRSEWQPKELPEEQLPEWRELDTEPPHPTGRVCRHPSDSKPDDTATWASVCGGQDRDQLIAGSTTGGSGYLLVGDMGSTSGSGGQPWALRLDSRGNEVWSYNYGAELWGIFTAVTSGLDGGYVLAGERHDSEYEIGCCSGWVLHVDEQGYELWKTAFGGIDWDKFEAILPVPLIGYLLAGGNQSNSSTDSPWLVQIDQQGRQVWQHVYHGGGRIHAIVASNEGGYLLVGWDFGDKKTSGQVLLIRVSDRGEELWRRTFGGSKQDYFHDAVASPDGGYVLAGVADASWRKPASSSGWLVKVDEKGEEQWQQKYGDTGVQEIRAIVSDGDRYLLAGSTQSDGWLIAVDQRGVERWQKIYRGKNSYDNSLNAISIQPDGGFLLIGTTWSADKTDPHEGVSDALVLLVDDKGDQIGTP